MFLTTTEVQDLARDTGWTAGQIRCLETILEEEVFDGVFPSHILTLERVRQVLTTNPEARDQDPWVTLEAFIGTLADGAYQRLKVS